jgi:hypothetical protein
VLGTFKLASGSAHKRVIIPVTTFSRVRTGKLTLKVVSARGKLVRVDGVYAGK